MTLHIIAQQAWNDPAFIVGTASSLAELRDALTHALQSHETAVIDMVARDGEHYDVVVQVVSDTEMQTIPYGYIEREVTPVMTMPLTSRMIKAAGLT